MQIRRKKCGRGFPAASAFCRSVATAAASAAVRISDAADRAVFAQAIDESDQDGERAARKNAFGALIAATEHEQQNEDPKAGIASEHIETVHKFFPPTLSEGEYVSGSPRSVLLNNIAFFEKLFLNSKKRN